MNSKEQTAAQYFDSGFNCAQSVLSAFAEDLDLERELAQRITSGFGSGMGRLQQTCGAVTGAFIVMGMYCTREGACCNDEDQLYSLMQKFNEKFKQINHGTTQCRELLNCDLNTDEGQNYFHENDIGEKVCQVCIKSSVKIIRDLLEIK